VLAGLALMQVCLWILDAAAGSPAGLAIAVVLCVVTPVLTFAFLSALWIMKVFAETLRGSV
jgi:hypothetical protein